MTLKQTLCGIVAPLLFAGGCVNFDHNAECRKIEDRALDRLRVKNGLVEEYDNSKGIKGIREGEEIRSSAHTKREKWLLAGMLLAHLADYETTRRNINSGGTELNPFLGKRPDADNILLFKGIVAGLAYLLADRYPEQREGIYGTNIISSGLAAAWNKHNYDNYRP